MFRKNRSKICDQINFKIMGNIFLFVCASAASAAAAYGFNSIGFSFATASISEAILASGIGIVLAGATALTARDGVRDFRRDDRQPNYNPLPQQQVPQQQVPQQQHAAGAVPPNAGIGDAEAVPFSAARDMGRGA